MASDQPDRLAELSRRLTDAAIEHQYDTLDPQTIAVEDGMCRLWIDTEGEWSLESWKSLSMANPITRALVIAAELFGE